MNIASHSRHTRSNSSTRCFPRTPTILGPSATHTRMSSRRYRRRRRFRENIAYQIDMGDAQAQDAIKKAIELDAFAAREMEVAQKLNQQIAASAPGTAPTLTPKRAPG